MRPFHHHEHQHDQQHDASGVPENFEISTGRLEAFSDGVFAIAITLLILDIKVPQGDGTLLHRLTQQWPSLGAYVISFLIIGMVWMNHHTMLFYIRRVDRPLMLFNLLLLMNVSFIPFPTHVLAEAMSTGHGEQTAAVFYGLTLTLGGIPFNAVWIYASVGHRHLGRNITPAQAAVMRKHFLMGPIMYLGATLVGLASAVASMTIFGVLLLFYMVEVLGSTSEQQHDLHSRSPVHRMTGLAEPPAEVGTSTDQPPAPQAAAPAVHAAPTAPAVHAAPPVPAAAAVPAAPAADTAVPGAGPAAAPPPGPPKAAQQPCPTCGRTAQVLALQR
ncbi:putative membrane protein [Kitasatospora sp. GP30]|uniref:TMEM175 family protein n=1 Tax=Kitasatospora sp. GP30 TaxID=3035084 RepID=UPI000C70D5A2|nr:TMEM175 family protein [Kitasatospora sp. GP30]MDH6138626.1 putative membrane protein [Kitasatospora sp. GP30]